MKTFATCLAALIISPLSIYAGAVAVNLGTAGNFAALTGSTITNAGNSIIDGDVGVAPGNAVTGFYPPGIVIGTIYGAGYDTNASVPLQAEDDLVAAYNFAAAEACPGGNNLTGTNLGGLTLAPGVYCFSSSAQLTGTLTLDALSDPNGVYVFQISTTLTTAPNSAVVFEGIDSGGNVFWQVGSSATLNTGTAFAGNILADTSISLDTGASLNCGSALAQSGGVTLLDNAVTSCAAAENAPEPGSATLLAMGLLLGVVAYGRQFAGRFCRKTPALTNGTLAQDL